jgi:hypothetical protein
MGTPVPAFASIILDGQTYGCVSTGTLLNLKPGKMVPASPPDSLSRFLRLRSPVYHFVGCVVEGCMPRKPRRETPVERTFREVTGCSMPAFVSAYCYANQGPNPRGPDFERLLSVARLRNPWLHDLQLLLYRRGRFHEAGHGLRQLGIHLVRDDHDIGQQ